jgi:endonuclease/exonuclease/phosphatase (EEP) superfamily protein YafD
VEHKQGWSVQLSQQAELDFSEILKWTAENFGVQQANEYAETLWLAIVALKAVGLRSLACTRKASPEQSKDSTCCSSLKDSRRVIGSNAIRCQHSSAQKEKEIRLL